MERATHQPLFAQAPLVQLFIFFSTGVLAAQVVTVPSALLLTFLALACLTMLLALLKRKSSLSAASLLFAMILAGLLLATIEKTKRQENQLKRLLDEGVIAIGHQVQLTGVIEGAVDMSVERLYFTLKAEQIMHNGVESKISGDVALIALRPSNNSVPYSQPDLHYGGRVRLKAVLRRTNNYRNPGVPLFTEYLDRKGYDATAFIKDSSSIEQLNDEPVFPPLLWLYDWRQKLQQEIDKRFSPQAAGVLDAALLGNRYNLSAATQERFRAGGTFHVLVISGLHISFIGGIVFLVSRRLTKKQHLQFTLCTIVLWGYAVAVGAEASVLRAALTFTVIALAPLLFRGASSLNALGGAGLTLLMWQPRNLLDPSFQLTFLSVLAIVVLAWPLIQRIRSIGEWRPTRDTPFPPDCQPWLLEFSECLFWSDRNWQRELAQSVYRCRLLKSRFAQRLERWHLQRAARYVFATILVSVSVQVVLLPFLIIYFHRLSPASIVLNIGVSLIMAALTLVALVALLVAQVSATLAAPLINLTNGLNWLMVHSVDPFVRLDIASSRLPHYSGPAGIIYSLYYVPLTTLVVSLRHWNPLALRTMNKQSWKIAVAAQGLFLGLIIFHPLSAGWADGKLHVDFLDVGQGDSALVTLPDGSTLLLDGGGRPNFSRSSSTPDRSEQEQISQDARSIGEAVVSEYLWWRGLDSVDYILATHADADHIDGLSDVARNFRVRSALVARMPQADPEFQKFAQMLRLRRMPVSLIGAGDVLHFGSIKILVLWPTPLISQTAPSGNNDSVVLRLEHGSRAIMLTGDIESEAEVGILQKSSDLQADVVKVAHHGSKTSSTEAFITATRPALAIISVGQTSMFGHPHKEVVERWKSSGAEVLTTGRSGTITVTTDGRDLGVKTFVH